MTARTTYQWLEPKPYKKFTKQLGIKGRNMIVWNLVADIVVSGKTFKYGAQGPEGLAGNKRVILAISRGGFYGAGTPAAVGEHLETYLRWVFGFIGITNPEFIFADGIQVGPEHREKALAGALLAATNLRAA